MGGRAPTRLPKRIRVRTRRRVSRLRARGQLPRQRRALRPSSPPRPRLEHGRSTRSAASGSLRSCMKRQTRTAEADESRSALSAKPARARLPVTSAMTNAEAPIRPFQAIVKNESRRAVCDKRDARVTQRRELGGCSALRFTETRMRSAWYRSSSQTPTRLPGTPAVSVPKKPSSRLSSPHTTARAGGDASTDATERPRFRGPSQ